jgi:alpha-L-fucosidase 2
MAQHTQQSARLFYRQPGHVWLDALPLGNGRIGAMVYGGVYHERVQLDESTFWSGEPSDGNVRGGRADVDAIRARLLAGEYREAEALCARITGDKQNYGTHLPLGSLVCVLRGGQPEVSGYTRWLDLISGVAGVSYTAGGRRLSREYFVSNPHQVAVMRLSAEPEAPLTFDLYFDGNGERWSLSVDPAGDLLLEAYARETIHSDGLTGVGLHGRVRVLGAREVAPTRGGLTVHAAGEAVVLVALHTSFASDDPFEACRATIERAASGPYAELRATHVADFSALMGRVAIGLGDEELDHLPTDARLARVKAGATDAGLDALLFQYGRYLIVASSRENSPLPCHLQGIWNDNLACRMEWTCDMHLDINTQMNYWPTEGAGLGDCNAPLFTWIAGTLAPSGERTARALYGCEGWVAHVVSNAWGYSAPGWHVSWGIWPMGGVWIATHLWEHYRFTGDRAFLERAYPLLTSCARFLLDYLVEDPAIGYLLSGPSLSPENLFLVDGARVANSLSPTSDTVLARELLGNCIAAAEALGRDPEFAHTLRHARAKLTTFKIGRHGQLQEWLEDHEAADPHHRHISHLLALYPFGQITREETPELAEAARRSLGLRLTPEGSFEIANWALALLMAYYARLGDGAAAYRSLQLALRNLAYANLFVCHPVYQGAETGIYELDGNTGVTAGVLEMLLQSHAGVIHLLPALPSAWRSGYVRGLRARGGFEIDITWRGGRVRELRVRSNLGGPCVVRAGDEVRTLAIAAGETAICSFG